MSNGDKSKQLFSVIIVIGYPGSGKGTQCTKIEKEFKYHHISTGNLLQRETLDSTLKYCDLIKQHRSAGTIVPHEITCGLLLEEMKKHGNNSKFIIDGYPRNEDNYIGWKNILEKNCSLKCVLFIDCSREVCLERCATRNRDEADFSEIITRRLNQFDQETRLIITKFGSLVHKIDGNQSINKVYTEIKKVLNRISL